MRYTHSIVITTCVSFYNLFLTKINKKVRYEIENCIDFFFRTIHFDLITELNIFMRHMHRLEFPQIWDKFICFHSIADKPSASLQ